MKGSSIPIKSRHLPLFHGSLLLDTPRASLTQHGADCFQPRAGDYGEKSVAWAVTGRGATVGGRATDSRALSRR